ncbi:MarR family winged helix-turn-helix transcriptional regulator [Salidesulfovibrio onnuriiensis]|uniref:MarR family winged helix-turn-helix transcriptional regulator n=1 Tax=Salidesulfovibrio onnuriiensis TaxID=2583823 RepID=UPI0011C73429|nr:MarR family winged helix-turn-helix transcriptional regulator [Salidesulfovibrio onnuriiensis]
MDEQERKFNEMSDWIVRIVDMFNASHEQGVDFGTGDLLFPAEIHTIEAVEEGRGTTVTALAEHFDVSKPTISERIKKLEKRGLLSKTKVAGTRDQVITLTPKGRMAFEGHRTHHASMFKAFAAQFGPDFNAAMEEMIRVFKQYYKASRAVCRNAEREAQHGPK